MAAYRRWIGEHQAISGFFGGFLGLASFGGAAWFLGTSAIFIDFMAMLGFLLGATALLALGGKRGIYEEIDAGIRDGRGDVEKLRSQIPYNQQPPPGI
jgi:hypothetical protein